MATAAVYTLLPLQERSSTIDGAIFPTARRTNWTFTFRVPVVGTSVTIKVQASPFGTGNEDWQDRHVTTINSAGEETVKHGSLSADEFTDRDVLIRAIVSANDGAHVVEVEAEAPFFRTSVADHLALLSDSDADRDELDRLAEVAENRVLTQAMEQQEDGRLMADLRSPLAPTLIRQAIAEQVTLESKRHDLMESSEAGDSYLSSGARLPTLAGGVKDTLAPILGSSRGAAVWTGRG